MKITQEELEKILNEHGLWLLGKNGKRADLSYINLQGADLRGADLRKADLRKADLRKADLQGANLLGADLQGADLQGADLRRAFLREADLREADLRKADLQGANLLEADLREAGLQEADLRKAVLWRADLRGADLLEAALQGANLQEAVLRGAVLRGADLQGANKIDTNILSVCPETGSFIAYKVANNHIVCLRIPEDARRSSATTRKCRCDKAEVISIEHKTSGKKVNAVASNYDADFVYEVGKMVEVPNFGGDRWEECAPGIHFFITREEAENYT